MERWLVVITDLCCTIGLCGAKADVDVTQKVAARMVGNENFIVEMLSRFVSVVVFGSFEFMF